VPPRIVALPRRGIAYVDCLYRWVAQQGVEVVDGYPTGIWPLGTVHRGDVVHLHWPSFYYYHSSSALRSWFQFCIFVLRLLCVRLLGGRLVWTAHNLYPHDGGRNVTVHRWCRRFVVRAAQTIFVHGPTPAGIVEREFDVPPAKLAVIPHGNWIDAYPNTIAPAQARQQLGLPAGAFVYGFVGLCKPYKNLERLIATFQACDDDAGLLVAGHFQSATYLATIRRQLAELPAGKVHFSPHFIEDTQLQLYVKACDAVVIPYLEVLTSGSALLALSFGVPVIAPNVAALHDLVDESCGRLYDPSDPAGLQRAMQEVRARKFDSQQIIARVRTLRWSEAAEALVRLLRSPRPKALRTDVDRPRS
jgi:beta-1,4-mannosyltransferase